MLKLILRWKRKLEFLPTIFARPDLHSVWFVYEWVRLSIKLVGEPLKSLSLRFLKSLASVSSDDANQSCGKGLSLKRSFTSFSEAQVKPSGCPSLIWSSISPINGQITRTTLFGYFPSQMFFCSIAVTWRTRLRKLLPKHVGITAKTSLPSSKQFTGIFCSSFSQN